jgi:hypothetical protein
VYVGEYVGEYVWVCGCVVVWVGVCVGVYTKSKTSELSPLRRKLNFIFKKKKKNYNIKIYNINSYGQKNIFTLKLFSQAVR